MVQGEQEDMVLLGYTQKIGVDQRAARQVEFPATQFNQAATDSRLDFGGREGAEILQAHPQRQLGSNHLAGVTVQLDKCRSQNLMALDDAVQTALQTGEVQWTFDPVGGRDVVGLRAETQTIQEPHARLPK
jgi:hypothetical protein